MNADLIIGLVALGFGLTTLVARFVAPESKLFGKLDQMKERFGERGGVAIHVLAYTVAPLGYGAMSLARYWYGVAP